MTAAAIETPRTRTGSIALVTGGGRGLGRVVAQALAAAGVLVGVLARSAAELEETVRLIGGIGGSAVAVAADVTSEPAVAAAVETVQRALGPIDVLVNNAGVNGPIGAFADVDVDEWWRTMEVNLGGAVRCCAAADGRGRFHRSPPRSGLHR